MIALGEHLYVHAGASRSTWVANMEEDPRVRVRADGKMYELAAARVEDQGEFGRFADAYQKKYGRRPRNENVDEAYLFRLGRAEGGRRRFAPGGSGRCLPRRSCSSRRAG